VLPLRSCDSPALRGLAPARPGPDPPSVSCHPVWTCDRGLLDVFPIIFIHYRSVSHLDLFRDLFVREDSDCCYLFLRTEMMSKYLKLSCESTIRILEMFGYRQIVVPSLMLWFGKIKIFGRHGVRIILLEVPPYRVSLKILFAG